VRLHKPEQVMPLIPVQRVLPLPEQAVPLRWLPAGASCAKNKKEVDFNYELLR